MESINMPQYDGQTLIAVNVTNCGDRPTTITNLGYLYFEKRRFHRSKIPDKAAIVPVPSTVQRLPFELKPGALWTGLAVQDSEIEGWATGGTLYMVLYHSHSEKPLRRRVEIRQEPASKKKT